MNDVPAKCSKPWFPTWLAHETLYNWCSRYNRVAGARRSAETAIRLFGHPRAGVSHDVPGCLSMLESRTGGASGSPRSVLWERTVLGYYLRFREADFAARVLERLQAGSGQALKMELGWPAARAGASHPLKACDLCLREDMAHGWPCWRLVHQLPGVWICPWHGCSLWVTNLKTAGLRRFDFLLPDEVTGGDRQLLLQGRLRPLQLVAAQRLAICTAQLIAAPGEIDLALLSSAFHTRLHEVGYARRNGTPDYARISERFAAYSQHFAGLLRADAVVVALGGAEALWRRLLAAKPPAMHPLRFLVPMTWLFTSWMDWKQCYDAACRQVPPLTATTEPYGAQPDHRHGTFFAALAAGCSVRAASCRAGVDVNTGLTWASKAGTPAMRRPKHVDAGMKSKIERQLRSGRSKEAIAKQHGISLTTVTRILLSTPGLRDARHEAVDRRHLGRARQTIQRCIASHPDVGRKELHLSAQAAYAWLYRHDRQWLADVLSTIPSARHPRASRVDWCDRDDDLVRSLAATQARGGTGTIWRSGAALARAVPELRPHLRHLDRLPHTAALIHKLLKKTPASAIA